MCGAEGAMRHPAHGAQDSQASLELHFNCNIMYFTSSTAGFTENSQNNGLILQICKVLYIQEPAGEGSFSLPAGTTKPTVEKDKDIDC